MSKESIAEPTSGDAINDRRVHLTIAASVEDSDTGALWAHKDLVNVIEPWAKEEHISPMSANEAFGDVDSFVAYVQHYGLKETTHLTWNSTGIKAVLDYAGVENEDDGHAIFSNRCQWIARLPFVRSDALIEWSKLASGHEVAQRTLVEKLEDLADDIFDPDPAELAGLLRALRANVSTSAKSELRPDGTSEIEWSRNEKVAGSTQLPSEILIKIPLLKGHVDEAGRPVLYALRVRLRVTVNPNAILAFRLSIPNLERTLETIYQERVDAAKAALGERYQLLRAAD